jgi:hypothetical protein
MSVFVFARGDVRFGCHDKLNAEGVKRTESTAA